jgi:glycerate-2-kinase
VSTALAAVDARRSTAGALRRLCDSLAHEGHIRVVAAGKAAVGMAQAVDDQLEPRHARGVITAPIDGVKPGWTAFPATHPRPSAASEAAGRAALALADEVRAEGGVLLVCLSGGASAMLAVPAAGLSIEDKAATTAVLLNAGLDIGAINTVRRHLSAIKGGQLAARAGRSITLAISDVCTPVEDDPAVIGSGPTSGDPSTFRDALAIINTHDLATRIPAAALQHLQAGAAGRVRGPVAADADELRQAAYWLIASRREAMTAAAETASRLGYHVHVVAPPTIGEARRAAPDLMAEALATGLPRPLCVIASGETTVHVTGSGRGGRNQELAVAALALLHQHGPAALASIGTDGVDGPTDAAGAMVDDSMWSALGVDADARTRSALETNDCYPFLEQLGALVRTGPTGTNVGDLQVLLLV